MPKPQESFHLPGTYDAVFIDGRSRNLGYRRATWIALGNLRVSARRHTHMRVDRRTRRTTCGQSARDAARAREDCRGRTDTNRVGHTGNCDYRFAHSVPRRISVLDRNHSFRVDIFNGNGCRARCAGTRRRNLRRPIDRSGGVWTDAWWGAAGMGWPNCVARGCAAIYYHHVVDCLSSGTPFVAETWLHH